MIKKFPFILNGILLRNIKIQLNKVTQNNIRNYMKLNLKRKLSKKMERSWRFRTTDYDKSQVPEIKTYTLLSFNILAQDLLVEHCHLYCNIEMQWLKWENRLRKLTAEIKRVNPDIICLQEMQYSHLKMLVQNIKGTRQMEYIYKKKTGHRTDGCVIIYDKSKFGLLKDFGLEYYSENLLNLNRENIGLLAKFRLREEPLKSIVVATTHLLYNPKRTNIRTAQVNKLLEHLRKFSTVEKKSGKSIHEEILPTVLTGDFNFEKNSKSYLVLTQQPENSKLNSAQSSNTPNNFQLQPVNFGGNECVSTYQDRWNTVDYILHTINNIDVRGVYQLPTINECIQMGQMPNKYFGSDHFSLAFNFSVLS